MVGVGRKQDWIVRLQPRRGPTFDATITAAVVRDWDGEPSSLRWMFREAPRIGLPGPRTGHRWRGLVHGRVRRKTARVIDRLGCAVMARRRHSADCWRASRSSSGRLMPGPVSTWFISPCAEKVFGYPAERWLSEPGFWAETIHQDDRSLAESQRQSLHPRVPARGSWNIAWSPPMAGSSGFANPSTSIPKKGAAGAHYAAASGRSLEARRSQPASRTAATRISWRLWHMSYAIPCPRSRPVPTCCAPTPSMSRCSRRPAT